MVKSTYKCCDQYDETTVEVLCVKPSKHYARLNCSHCNKFRKWCADPSIDVKVQTRNDMIDEFIKNHELSEKTLQILNGIKLKRFPTPSQLNALSYIMLKLK